MTPEGKYSEAVEQVRQAETIILGNAEILLRFETLSQEGKQRLEEIKRQFGGLTDY